APHERSAETKAARQESTAEVVEGAPRGETSRCEGQALLQRVLGFPEPLGVKSVCAAAVAVAAFVGCALSASAAVPAFGLQNAVGAYRFAAGSAAALVYQGGALRLVDYRTGALRQLEQRSRALFVGGPGVSVPQPVAVRVALVDGAGGKVAAVRLDGRL